MNKYMHDINKISLYKNLHKVKSKIARKTQLYSGSGSKPTSSKLHLLISPKSTILLLFK